MNYKLRLIKNLAAIVVLSCGKLYAQDSAKPCQVKMVNIMGSYSGDCKNGYANGKGEAKGADRYIGLFKNGLPNGKGTYYYGDSLYYTGNFQDGVKEGKGEIHDLRNGTADSLIKGYWSADEYRGKKYITYNFTNTSLFDQVTINPSSESGNTVTISTSSYLTLNLISTDGNFIKLLNTFTSPTKRTTTYEIDKFPARLEAVFSGGQACNIELYKQANWKIELLVYRLHQ